MTDDALLANADLAAIARLTAERDELRAALAQQRRATLAEMTARHQAEADVGWWHATVANFVTSVPIDREVWIDTLTEATNAAHPGAALLAELDAARAFIREIRGAMLIGGWRDSQSALLSDYDAATKVRK